MYTTPPQARCLVMLILPFYTGMLYGQGIAINDTGASPNPHALLDVDASTHDRGVLLPRMTTAERTAIAGLGAAENGLTVYDSTTKSYWFWDGVQWVQMGGGGAGWGLTGNAGTINGTHFLGTVDFTPLSFRVNNEHAGRVEAGFWGNTYFGHEAGLNNVGLANVAVGARSLGIGNVGWLNSAFGSSSLGSNSTGELNTAVGNSALFSNSSGSNNTALGGNALSSNGAGSNGTAIGANAMAFANSSSTPFENTNVAVGYEALRGSMTATSNTGLGNTAIGYQALKNNESGWSNIACGHNALSQNTTGGANVAIGAWSMYQNTTGQQNTAVGNSTLTMNTTGFHNCAFGGYSLLANTSGVGNSAIGEWALESNVDGNYNAALGAQALRNNQTGSHNVALGYQALRESTSASGNVAIGHRSLFNANGVFNCAVGPYTLEANISGTGNTAVGRSALSANQGSSNVAVGFNAGTGSVASVGSVAIGALTGGAGSFNVFIGTNAGFSELGSHRLYIENTSSSEPLVYGEFDNDFVRINHNLGVGCSSFGGGTKVLAIEAGVAPIAPIPNGGLIFAALDSGVYELRAMDGAGNVTSFSPHNFSLVPRSEPMAWSYWSENRSVGRRINVDMLRVVRLVEQLSGAQLVHEETTDGTPISAKQTGKGELDRLRAELRQALEEIARLRERVKVLESR